MYHSLKKSHNLSIICIYTMYRDIRARLEVAIDKVSTAAKYQPTEVEEDKSGYNSDSEEVRKNIATLACSGLFIIFNMHYTWLVSSILAFFCKF